jgi:hypothetical protein
MKADLTRNTFHPFKNFTRVLMQQGRVQIDADWNEQAAILTRYLRSLAADIIGPQGGPQEDLGFAISPLTVTPKVGTDFAISAGDYYVDGILCANDPTPVAVSYISGTEWQVRAEVWTVDGISFAKGQLLEAFDTASPPNRALTRITDVNEASRILSLDAGFSSINPSATPRVRHVLTYTTQPDYPIPQSDLTSGVTYRVYLDVWERLITPVEDDSICEVALGGADTAARAKLVCQVKCMQASTCGTPQDLINAFQPHNRGFLKARTKSSAASADPCIISPNSRYRGPENQLYRVEIHTGGVLRGNSPSGPTFKWSRENGSVVFPITSGGGTNVVTLETLGRDDRFGLAEGDWVEVQDDVSVLLNRVDNLLQVQSIDRTTMQVTLNGTLSSSVGNDPTKHPLLRRWDQRQGDEAAGGLVLNSADHAIQIVEGTGDTNWLDLEDGVQIQFQKPDSDANATSYRTGDYWLIPARTATGNVEWPTEIGIDSQKNPIIVPAALPPLGVTHHYAPLAIFVAADGTAGQVLNTCQWQFKASAGPA